MAENILLFEYEQYLYVELVEVVVCMFGGVFDKFFFFLLLSRLLINRKIGEIKSE